MHINAAARAFRATKQQYHAAFRDYFTHDVTPLPDDRFWQLQQVFAREVITFRFAYGRSHGVEQAAREFYRRSLAGDFGAGGRYTLQEANRFAKTWPELRQQLYQPLFDVVQDRGDDAYGDLLDALPLAGREVTRRALDREYGNQQQFERAVLAGCQGHQQLAELILHGENYCSMALYDAARHYLVPYANDG